MNALHMNEFLSNSTTSTHAQSWIAIPNGYSTDITCRHNIHIPDPLSPKLALLMCLQFQSHVLNRTRKAGGAVEVLATGQVQQPLDSGSSSSSSIGASAIRTAGMLSPVVREIIKNDAAVASSGVTAQPGGAQGAPQGEVLLSMEAKQQAVKGAMVHAWTSVRLCD